MLFFCGCFCLLAEINKEQKVAGKCFQGFSECWVFLDTCCFCLLFFFSKRERSLLCKFTVFCRSLWEMHFVAILSDITSSLAFFFSYAALRRHMFAGERFGQRGRQRSQTLLRALNLLLPSQVLRLCFLQYFVDIFFLALPSLLLFIYPPSSGFLPLFFCLCLYPAY